MRWQRAIRYAAATWILSGYLGGAWAWQSRDAETKTLPEVTIEAQRESLKPLVHSFVYQITAQVSDHWSLARWGQPICPLVAGLPVEQGEAVLTRLSEIAIAATAKLAPPDCAEPNFEVLVTSDPKRLLTKWRARNPLLFGPVPPEGGEVPIRRFINTDRPVRVWYNTEVTDSAGATPNDGHFLLGDNAIRAPSVGVWDNPRMTWTALLKLSTVIIVVDSRRVKGFSVRQLADYIGMIGLAQPNLDSDVQGAPTILSLFADSSATDRPQGLSEWDYAFLKGLYRTDQASPWQRSQIVRYVVQDLVHP
jgi:hypothetical protein